MEAAAFDYRQVTDVFAAARAARLRGSITFHFEDGNPKNMEIHWRLSFGEQVQRWVRQFLGKPPPN